MRVDVMRMPPDWAYERIVGKSVEMPAKLNDAAGYCQSAEPLPAPKTPGFVCVGLQPNDDVHDQVATALETIELLVPSMRTPPFEWYAPVITRSEPAHTFALMILEYSATDGRM